MILWRCNITLVKRLTSPRLPLVMLCLTLFQCQVFAASALGCLHAGASGERGAIGASADLVSCPHHSGKVADQALTADAQSAAGDLLDCAKCALNCSVSHYDRASCEHALTAPPVASASQALPPRHFYRHSPESFLRPPIPTAV